MRLSPSLIALSWACHAAEPIPLPPAPAVDGERAIAPEVLPGEVQQLALGLRFSCALLRGGFVKCWGSDEHGVLGQDTQPRDVSDPSQVPAIDFGSSRQVIQIAAGWYHVCVLFDDERARCWGRNDSGQLGLGNSDDYGDETGETLNALQDLPLEQVIQISAGVSNTCVLVRSGLGPAGTVHCFGSDIEGALGDAGSGNFGDDEPVNALRPAALQELATAVAAGDSVNCARLVSGQIQCWGSNAFGSLGIGPDPCDAAAPRVCPRALASIVTGPVANLDGRFITELRLNQAHACVVDNRGELSCWGRNDQSRAGYPHAIFGTILDAPPGPLDLGAEVDAIGVGLGARHGCALDTLGLVRCWGESGPQLGYAMLALDGAAGVGGTQQPASQYALMPEGGAVQLGDTDETPGTDRALRVVAGGWHTCVILESGAVRCWGVNASGQLGYGDFSQVGDVGATSVPAVAYEQRQRYDVCFSEGEAATTGCAN